MNYMGDFLAGKTVVIPFNTFNSTGASVTVTDLVAGDVHIHKDGGVTQRTSSSGVTVSIDFDGITGCHEVLIDTSNNADAGFYSAGADFQVRLEGITVDSQTLNPMIGTFSIQNRYMRGTDIGSLNDLSSSEVWTYGTRVLSANTNLNDPASSEIWTYGTRTLSAGTNLNDLSSSEVWTYVARVLTASTNFNDLSSADVQIACTASLSSYDPPTKTEMDSGFSALTDITSSEVWTYATRVLTASTNLNDLSSSDIQTASAAALTAYDPPTKTELDSGFLALNDLSSSEIWTYSTRVLTANTNLNDPSSSEIWTYGTRTVTAGTNLNDISVADIISGIADGTYDLQEMLRIIFAFAAGKSTGGGTTTHNFRDSADSKNRIIGTVDADGNRTAMTLDGS